MEESLSSCSEKTFDPSPDLEKSAFLQGHGESRVLGSLPPPDPGLFLATAAKPEPPGCCLPTARSSLSPFSAVPAALAHFWGW